MKVLVDECCPRAVVDALRRLPVDVRYAAETDARATDDALLALAFAERRVPIAEDFDFGDLIFRDGSKAVGAIIVYMPSALPNERADRLVSVMQDQSFVFEGSVTIVEQTRIRRRLIGKP